MGTSPENARYEDKQRAAGFVRGPRITAEAAERLRILAFRHRLTPCEVVSRLLLDVPMDASVDVADVARTEFQRREGLSDAEMRG